MMTFAFPVVMWLLFFIITTMSKQAGFASSMGMEKILRDSVLSTIIAFAIALPLSGGRWDFGVGAIIALSSIIGGNIAIQNNLNIAVMIGITVAAAVLLSVAEGIIYIFFRIPNMIVSLGVVMLYEALTGILFNGEGVQMFRYNKLTTLATAPSAYILLIVIIVLFHILLKYTRFGYDTRSLASNPKLAINNGVNEKKNIVLTYLVVGVLLGFAAVINASIAVVSPASNLSSTNLMFSSMGPVLIGLYLARFTNMPLGILSGSLGMNSLSFGMAVLGFHSSLQMIVLGAFIVIFMGYTTNQDKIKNRIRNRLKTT